MIKVKQLKLRIFAQFVIIIAPITLVLIYQAVSDQRRTAAVESVVVRHGLSRATKEGFESFMTHAADAVDMGSLGQRAYEALRQSAASASQEPPRRTRLMQSPCSQARSKPAACPEGESSPEMITFGSRTARTVFSASSVVSCVGLQRRAQ